MIRNVILNLTAGCRGIAFKEAHGRPHMASSFLSSTTRVVQTQSVQKSASRNGLSLGQSQVIPLVTRRYQHAASSAVSSTSPVSEERGRESASALPTYAPPTSGLLSVLPPS